jgi:release factor glutamine methyltransferase
MTIMEALKKSRRLMASSEVSQPGLESEILLRHVAHLTPVELILRYKEYLPTIWENRYFELVGRRISGESSAYITGQKEFYGLTYYVNNSVLIPRPETELLVERALELASKYKNPVIADIGTGSGIIAVTLAKYLPRARVLAGDVSPEAIELARKNAKFHGVDRRISFYCADLLSFIVSPVDIIVANLPYVPSGFLPDSGEPRIALDGGAEGLDVISRLCAGLEHCINIGGSVLLEVGLGQANNVHAMLMECTAAGDVVIYRDLARLWFQPALVGL